MKFVAKPIRTMIMVATAVLAVAFAAVPTAVLAQEETGVRERTLNVSATGQVEVVPDVAVVRLGVETQAETAMDALTQNSDQMTTLIESLTASGVMTDQIQTQQVQILPVYSMPTMEPVPEPQPSEQEPAEEQNTLLGYRAVNVVSVRLEGMEGLGTLLDSAIEAGGNRIDGIWFEMSDPQAALDEARAAAWEEAQRKGQALAELAGLTLGEVISIGETSFLPVSVAQSMMAGADMGVPIQPGTITLQADIHVTWRISDGEE